MDAQLLQQLIDAKDEAEKSAIIAEEAFASLPEEMREIVLRPVILHWFDEGVLDALKPSHILKPAVAFERFRKLPFIEVVPLGLTFHAQTRSGLISRLASGDPDFLIESASRAARSYCMRGKDISYLLESFFCSVVAGEIDSAKKQFQKIVSIALSKQDLRLISALLDMQDEAEALEFVSPLDRDEDQKIIRAFLDKDPETGFRNLGIEQQSQGDALKAIGNFSRAIELNGNDGISLYHRALSYAGQGELELALVDLDRVIEINPNDAEAFNTRGNIRKKMCDYGGALRDYTASLEINQDDPLVHYNLGLLYQVTGELEPAIEKYGEALALDSSYTDAYLNRSVALRLNKKPWLAVKDAEMASRLRPEDSSAIMALAGAYIEAGRRTKGSELARSALQELPASDFYSRACLNALIGRVDEAARFLEKSIERDPAIREWVHVDPDWRSIIQDHRIERQIAQNSSQRC